MAVSPIPNCVQMNVNMVADGQRVMNTFYYKFPGTPNAFDLNTMLAAANTAWATYFSVNLSTAIALHSLTAVDLSGPTGVRIDRATDPPVPGEVAGDYLPLNATAAFKRSGAVRGRGVNGRIFWPILAEAQVTGDQLTDLAAGDFLDAVVAFDNAVKAACPSGTLQVIPHKTGLYRGTATPIEAWVLADKYIDSQRDRLPFHRRHKKRVAP